MHASQRTTAAARPSATWQRLRALLCACLLLPLAGMVAAFDDPVYGDGFDGDSVIPAHFRGTNVAGMTLRYSFCLQAGGPVPDSNFHVFDARVVDYYAGKGMKSLRVLFSWECVQPVLNGPIPAAGANYQSYFNALKELVSYATRVKKMHVIITPWQSNAGGGLCGACWSGNVIGSAQVTNAHFADFWTRMANHFRNNTRVGFSLVNEPNTMSTMQWFSAAQAAITAIRATGATQRIYVPGNGYTAASSWEMDYYDTAAPKRSNAYGWLNARGVGQPLADPLNKLFVEVHTYLDEQQNGETDAITSITAARQNVNPSVAWARARGLKVYLGEIGLYAGNPIAAQAWGDFLNYANANTDTLVGFSWWAGGYPQWWTPVSGPYFSIAPIQSNYSGDTINMTMIQGAFQ